MRMKVLNAALAVAIVLPVPAQAADEPIAIAHPWLRATPRTAPVVGGYVTLTNTGKEPEMLVSASLPMAPAGQIHTMTMRNGIMEMRRLDGGLLIAPGATVTLRPGGDHLMFLKPTAQLKEGESIKGSLTFKHAGMVPVTFVVGGMAAKAPPGTGAVDHSREDMKGMEMGGMH